MTLMIASAGLLATPELLVGILPWWGKERMTGPRLSRVERLTVRLGQPIRLPHNQPVVASTKKYCLPRENLIENRATACVVTSRR